MNFIDQNIYTIDSFQGKEQENVIINWVRSNYTDSGLYTRTGFLRDYRGQMLHLPAKEAHSHRRFRYPYKIG